MRKRRDEEGLDGLFKKYGIPRAKPCLVYNTSKPARNLEELNYVYIRKQKRHSKTGSHFS